MTFDPVHDTQAVHRALVRAFSFPGTGVSIEGPATDSHNPDPALRARSLIGVQVLSGFTQEGDAWHGTLYYPFGGKTYRAYISRNPDNSLKVRGCWYFICRTVKWPAADGAR